MIKHDYECGIVNIKLSIFCNSSPPIDQMSLEKAKSWQYNPFGKKIFRYSSLNVRCYIFQCRGLSPADENGVSDPFVKILSHFSEDSTTPVIEDNLNPMFLCTRTVSMEFREKSDFLNTPVLLSVFDSDKGILSNS